MTGWRTAGIAGALAVALGAFGAHGLEERVSAEALAWWETGARYHLAHAVALGLVAAHPRPGRVAGLAFAIGILLFSGSLYAMTLTGVRWLGAVTPLGGIAFITGWVALAATGRPGAGRPPQGA